MRIPVRTVLLVVLALVASTLISVSAVAPASAVTKKRLKSAWVSSMCGHPAGRLKNGKLPEDDDPHNGSLEIARSAVGPLVKGKPKKKWGAAVIRCNAGGVPWPDHLAFYKPNGKYAGSFNMSDVTKGQREYISRISISKRRVNVRVEGIVHDTEGACCGTGSASVKFKWNARKKKMVVAKKTVYSAEKTAKAFTKAMNAGNHAKARRLTDADTVSQLAIYRPQGVRLGVGPCRSAGFMKARNCTITISDNPIGQLQLTKTNWKTWRGTRWYPN